MFKVDGVVEEDEVFFAYSYKGTKTANMPSPSRKRGKEVKKRGRHKEDVYHIQHINAVHSNIKRWMRRFNGIATKYISNYLKWFECLDTFSTEKDTVKTKNFIVQSNVPYNYTMIKDFKISQPIFV